MRDVTIAQEGRWRSGLYIGDTKPMVRVTVQHPHLDLYSFHLTQTFKRINPAPSGTGSITTSPTIDPTKTQMCTDQYASYLFNPPAHPMELPNVRSMDWSRSLDGDSGTATIVFYNQKPLGPTDDPLPVDLDNPGYYTPGRGSSFMSKTWGQVANQWQRALLPDNLLRTYEGYGFDKTVPPELDDNLMLSGIWKIDTVDFSTPGYITCTCRDMGFLLIDQFCMSPVIPRDFYPVGWRNWDEKIFMGLTQPQTNRLTLTPTHSSNEPWIGSGVIAGHSLRDAFDNKPGSYWLSIGNVSPSKRFAYEWIEAKVNKQTVRSVKFRPKKGHYTAYVSVKIGGVWQGSHSIDYHRDGIGMNGGDIPYVKSVTLSSERDYSLDLGRDWEKVTAIRLTFGNLQYFPGFGTYNYRAGIASFSAYGPVGGGKDIYKALKPGPAGANPGFYSDYTDIVKLLCVWAGLFWPKVSKVYDSNGTQYDVSPAEVDAAVLGPATGRVWGDFEQTGTNGPIPFTTDNFDKKSLMDCIKVIQEIIGFVFFIDASGGVQWRMPNIYTVGNWLTGLAATPARTTKMYTLDDRTVLQDFSPKLTSQNLRDAVYVSDVTGKFGAVAPGFNPNPTGLRRIAGWTDQGFQSVAETEAMADSIVVRQMFTYRTSTVKISGFCGIDIDDQVRIQERVTNESFIHYVRGVSNSWNAESGEYTTTLQTNWLGADPGNKWFFKSSVLSPSWQNIQGTRLAGVAPNRIGTRLTGSVLP